MVTTTQAIFRGKWKINYIMHNTSTQDYCSLWMAAHPKRSVYCPRLPPVFELQSDRIEHCFTSSSEDVVGLIVQSHELNEEKDTKLRSIAGGLEFFVTVRR